MVREFEAHIRLWLTAQNLEPASHSVSLFISALPLLTRSLSLSLFPSKINKHEKKFFNPSANKVIIIFLPHAISPLLPVSITVFKRRHRLGSLGSTL